MHRRNLMYDSRSFYSKILVFIIVLFFGISMYIESGLIIDLVYTIVVFILFVRFLTTRLYF